MIEIQCEESDITKSSFIIHHRIFIMPWVKDRLYISEQLYARMLGWA